MYNFIEFVHHQVRETLCLFASLNTIRSCIQSCCVHDADLVMMQADFQGALAMKYTGKNNNKQTKNIESRWYINEK